MIKLSLFLSPTAHGFNEQATKMLARAFGQRATIEEIAFFGTHEPLFNYPFVRDEADGLNWYAIKGIEAFIRLAQQKIGNLALSCDSCFVNVTDMELTENPHLEDGWNEDGDSVWCPVCSQSV